MEETVMPYRKKRRSSTSSSSKKSKHKHIWAHCFLHTNLPDKYFSWIQDPERKRDALDQLAPGLRCPICGVYKQDYNIDIRFRQYGKYLMGIGKNELKRLHPEWPVIEVPGEDWYKI